MVTYIRIDSVAFSEGLAWLYHSQGLMPNASCDAASRGIDVNR